jgi:hypothetical protein
VVTLWRKAKHFDASLLSNIEDLYFSTDADVAKAGKFEDQDFEITGKD